MVGTGQTAWMQGVKYGVVEDCIISDFVAGEIEHAVYRAWSEAKPDVIVVEGQGSLMNPAYPGGFEIIGAARPDVIVLQHAPAREEYDGFPGYRIHPLPVQIQALELVSGKRVAGIAINHENLTSEDLPMICRTIEGVVGVPTVDVLVDGPGRLVDALAPLVESARGGKR